MSERATDVSGWWVVVVRIASVIKGEDPSMEEFSLRLVAVESLEHAKSKACAAALVDNPAMMTTDGKPIIHAIKSVMGAEYLGDQAPQDGAELWSRLSFLDREEDRPLKDDSPPFWALRAFNTDWNVTGLEERT